MAATERVLTHARSGMTAAHLALGREALAARAELKEASHRLMVDFLDDGARAFKGSKRVADSSLSRVLSTWMPYADAGGSDLDDFQRIHGHSPEEMRVLQQYLDHKGLPTASKRVTADETTGFAWQSDNPLDDDDPYFQDEDFRRDADDLHALEHKLRHGPHDDDDPARYSRRTANAEWQARQESELDPEMRGNYYDGPASDDCRHCGERIEERGSGGYGHVLGEDPYTGDTTYYPDDDHPAEPDDEDYRTASRRTATVADFDDQLLFGS
jgi:hypothetical protein